MVECTYCKSIGKTVLLKRKQSTLLHRDYHHAFCNKEEHGKWLGLTYGTGVQMRERIKNGK